MARKDDAAYNLIIRHIFFNHYKAGIGEFEFVRREIVAAKEAVAPDLDLNPGDVVYSYRFRRVYPKEILDTQPAGQQWIIEGAGKARYRFRLVSATRITPSIHLAPIDIPDATPEIIRAYALDDEQALLAIVRYNRLIDTFLGITTYSLQNHLRTAVKGIGQIEIDELYVGVDKHGCHHIVPVQAKGGKDQIGVVQTNQDIRYVAQKFPSFRCRPIAAQFMDEGTIALFELTLMDMEIKVLEEKHYRLIPARDLDGKSITNYR
jgi:hypothetical protein